MKRREFITLLSGGAAAWPLAARAQQQPKRIGVLSEYEAEFREQYASFRDRLAQLGWAEPSNLRIDYRWVDAKPELREARAREIISLAPNVIFAQGPSAEAARRLTRTIPIVFSTATDPVAAGYVQSFAHPGGNMTGFVGFEASINSKWLQLLKDVAPNVTRVSVLRFGSIAPARSDFHTAKAAARAIAVTPVDALVKDDAADISRVIAAFSREPNGGLVVPPGNTPYKHRDLIVMLANRHRLPAIYDYREFAVAGGLMSYGANRSDNYRGAAEYVDRILRGANPADLPVQAPTKYELVINLKTARALGLAVPPSLLAIADEVIE